MIFWITTQLFQLMFGVHITGDLLGLIHLLAFTELVIEVFLIPVGIIVLIGFILDRNKS